MRYLPLFVACSTLTVTVPILPQSVARNEEHNWGNWDYTSYIVGGVKFRTRCESSANGDSEWAYQFKGHFWGPTDFIEREEHAVAGTAENEMGTPVIMTIDAGDDTLTPIFHAQLHGTCDELQKKKRELKIEVLCVVKRDDYLDLPCFKDANGQPVGYKELPKKPSYK